MDPAVCTPGGSLVISVRVTGAGLSAGNMKQLFKEGVQFNAKQLQAGGESGFGSYNLRG